MKVRGHKDIALEFYGLIKAFSDVKVVQKSLLVTEGNRPDVYEASIENTQLYITGATVSFTSPLLLGILIDPVLRCCQVLSCFCLARAFQKN
jgi:hypothetical protein